MVRRPAFVTALVIGFTMLSAMPAALADDSRQLQVEGQALSESLKSVADEFGLDIAFFSESTNGLRGVPLAGNYTSEEAFDTLLSDTELEHRQLDNGTVVIQAKDKGGDSDSGNGKTAGVTPKPVMMAQAAVEQSQTSQKAETDSDEDEKKRPLEEIVVTGTHIRGIAPESSPTRTFTREDIQISGAGTAQDFIQTLTANFGGGSNVRNAIGLPNDTNASSNGPGSGGALGSSVNLRGLGSGGTLVLLNGRRLAPSSSIGDFVDISVIPASAIERVDVLTDGASSIYGGDAVAGVVNFILRDDFDGVETSHRYGTVTEGDLNEYRGSVSGGKTWDSGNALVTYEYFKRDDLSAGDRAFSQDAVLPFDLLPSEERHSLLASASQELSTNFKFNMDLIYSNRKSVLDQTQFAPGDTHRRGTPTSNTFSISGGGSWRLGDRWFVDFSGTYSDLKIESESVGAIELERETDSRLWSADLKTSGPLVELPGGELKLAIGSQFRNESFTSFNVATDSLERQADRDIYAFFGEALIPIVGPDNSVSGIERLEINVSGRLDDYSDFGTTVNPKVGVLWSPVESLNVRGSYSTSFNPPPLGRVGASDRFVGVFTTKFFNDLFGFAPADPSIADVILLLADGTASDLDAEESRAFTAGFDFDKQWSRHNLAFAATWFDIEFEGRLGRIPIPGNVSRLVAHNIAFDNPSAFPEGTIIFSPTADQIRQFVDNADSFFSIFGDDPFDAEIINTTGMVRNLNRTLTSGIDFDLNYSFELNNNRNLFLGVDGTYLIDFQQQAVATTPLVELLNTLYIPVDFKLRGRAGYAHDGFTANLFVNYTDSYVVDNTAGAEPISSWTTIDLNFSYNTGEEWKNSILNNTIFRMSVLNLFDEEPPSTPTDESFRLVGYDPTNASPLGRFIAFEITKQF